MRPRDSHASLLPEFCLHIIQQFGRGEVHKLTLCRFPSYLRYTTGLVCLHYMRHRAALGTRD